MDACSLPSGPPEQPPSWRWVSLPSELTTCLRKLCSSVLLHLPPPEFCAEPCTELDTEMVGHESDMVTDDCECVSK